MLKLVNKVNPMTPKMIDIPIDMIIARRATPRAVPHPHSK
jgi:hypothetical protein